MDLIVFYVLHWIHSTALSCFLLWLSFWHHSLRNSTKITNNKLQSVEVSFYYYYCSYQVPSLILSLKIQFITLQNYLMSKIQLFILNSCIFFSGLLAQFQMLLNQSISRFVFSVVFFYY